MLKKADIYDLIKISMKSSSNKISAMDRYIQRALERQAGSPDGMIDADCYSQF